MPEPGTRTSLALALGILALIFIGIGQFIVLPLITTLIANQQKLQDTVALRERYRALLSTEPALLRQVEEESDDSSRQIYYLDGSTPALAGVTLQNRTREALTGVDSEISSLEMLPVATVEHLDSLERIGLRARFSLDTAELADLIFDLEAGVPYLSLENLVITKQMISSPASGSEHDETLDVSVDIFGVLPR